MEIKPRVLSTLDRFVAVCRGGLRDVLTRSGTDSMVDDATITNISVGSDGRIDCNISIKAKMPVQLIKIDVNINSLFLQDGLLTLPDGTGLYESYDTKG